MEWPWQKQVEMPPEAGIPGPPESIINPHQQEQEKEKAAQMFKQQPIFYPGRIVFIDGFQFRITNAKENGRLFLKLIK